MAGDVNQRICERICNLADGRTRFIVSISGPPGAGKSTLADVLLNRINEREGKDSAVVLPMDGFHLDNTILQERGHLARKGAPHTFDVDGFATLLNRVKQAEHEVLLPVFDRELDLSRAGYRAIRADHRIVLVEGNYLLLDKPQWSVFSPLFDYRVALGVDESVLTQRLIQRWLDHGLTPDAAVKRAESNDLPNARLVASKSLTADCLLHMDGDGLQTLS